ncbi:MAG: stage III sporulation protein AA [Bacillota bacterium]
MEPDLSTLSDPLERDILPLLPETIRALILGMQRDARRRTEEIRLRAGRPLAVYLDGSEVFLSGHRGAHVVTAQEVFRTLQAASGSSVYAWEDDIRQGFITLRGGHRLGLAGRAVVVDGRIQSIQDVGSVAIRVAREIPGAAKAVLHYVVDVHARRVRSTLLLSPPQCGKTTMLRDLIRSLSCGDLRGTGFRVGLVDERSEVAAAYMGIPQKDVGPRTDVLYGCPKSQGLLLLLRSMAPDVLATDEVGSEEDAKAISEITRAGVAVLATAHGAELGDIAARPSMKSILNVGAFSRCVVLSRRSGPGTVEAIYDLASGRKVQGGDLMRG